MRRILTAFLVSVPVAVAIFVGAPPATRATAPPRTPATVTVRVGNDVVSSPVPPGFIGFSFEFQAVRQYTGPNPHAINPVLVQLIRNVAPGQSPVLRIGGNSTDGTWWPTPRVAQVPGINYTLTNSWLATTKELAKETGARLILGLNLKLDSLVEDVTEARAYRRGIGTRYIEALEIGNEPELYRVFPWYGGPGNAPVYARPSTYDPAAYEREVARIARRLGKLPLAGPATGAASWLSHDGQLFGAEPRLKVVTYHRYPLLACFTTPTDPRYPSIPNLLSADSSRALLKGAAPGMAAAHAHGATVRLDELNSVACKGQQGVSDTFASALWMLDTLFAMARAHVDGVNIHSLPDAVYKPFTFRQFHGRWLANVSPEYYALLMFGRAAPPGSRLLGVRTTRSPDIRARATSTRAGLIHVVVINDSLSSGHTVLVRPSGPAGAAVLERLRAPGAGATAGVTLAGQSFGNVTATGVLKGKLHDVHIKLVHGRYLIRLPAASAALLTFAPARSSK